MPRIRRRRTRRGIVLTLIAALLGAVPSRAEDDQRVLNPRTDNDIRVSSLPTWPAVLVGANGKLSYLSQTDVGTAAQELGFVKGSEPSADFPNYVWSEGYGKSDVGQNRTSPWAYPSAVGDVDYDGNPDFVSTVQRYGRKGPAGVGLGLSGSQRGGFVPLGSKTIPGARHLVVLEGGDSAGSPPVAIVGSTRFVAYSWSGEWQELPTTYELPAGLDMSEVLDVWHRHDWDREAGEAAPSRDARFLVLGAPETGQLKAWEVSYSLKGGTATLDFKARDDGRGIALSTPSGRQGSNPTIASIRYDWVGPKPENSPAEGLIVGVRTLYARDGGGYDAYLSVANATPIDILGTLVNEAPRQFCSSSTEAALGADLDLEAVSFLNPTWVYVACASVEAGQLRSELLYAKGGDGRAHVATGPGPVNDATILRYPQSQIVFPCLWVLEHSSTARCSSKGADGKVYRPGNAAVATVVNAGTSAEGLTPTYVSRSFNPEGAAFTDWWATGLPGPAPYFAVHPLPHQRNEVKVRLDNLDGVLAEADPLPLAVLAAPPQVRGAGQVADPPAFATTSSQTDSAGDSLTTKVGAYFGYARQTAAGSNVGGFRVDIDNEVTVATKNSFTVEQTETFNGLTDADVMVYEARSIRRFDGRILTSSLGLGLDQPASIAVPLGTVTSAASIAYVKDQFPLSFGELGAFGGLLDAVFTHKVGDPGSYMTFEPNGVAIDGYCDGSIDDRPQRDWRGNRNLPPVPGFPFDIPEVPKKPDVLYGKEPHQVLVGTGNSEGTTLGITSETETSRVASLSVTVEGGLEFGGFFGGAKVGFGLSRDTSAALAAGQEFTGSVGHIPGSNDFLRQESYQWRMFMCQKTVPTGIGELKVWVQNFTVDRYAGSGGLQDMSPVEVVGPRHSETPLAKAPLLTFSQKEGTVRRYDYELEAVGVKDHISTLDPENKNKGPIEFESPRVANRTRQETNGIQVPRQLQPHQLYRWRVIATDFFGNQVTSPYEYFQTDGPTTPDFSITPQPAAGGERVTFHNTSRASRVRPTEYTWKFGDGTEENHIVQPGEAPPEVQHTYAEAGVYPVSLTASTPDFDVPPPANRNVVVAAAAVPLNYEVREDDRLSVEAPGVLAQNGAGGRDGDPVYASLAAPAVHGTARVAPDGALTYVPDPDYCGPEEFPYFVHTGQTRSAAPIRIRVMCEPDAPVAAADSFSTAEDNPVQVPAAGVLANDRDGDRDVLAATPVGQPGHGTLALDPGGGFTYTPAPDFCGDDSFEYRASDQSGRSSGPAAVGLRVTCVNDRPEPGDDQVETPEDRGVTVPVLDNDTDVDGDVLRPTISRAPAHGSATITTDGKIVYTPVPDFNGEDRVPYSVDDGHGGTDSATLAVTVRAVNDPPVAVNDGFATLEDTPARLPVLANDRDVDGDPLTVGIAVPPAVGTAAVNGDGTITYIPPPDYHGGDTFGYEIDDGQGSQRRASVAVTVVPVNDRPVALDDQAETDEGKPVAIPVLGNDGDIDGDRLVVKVATPPQHGTTVVNADFSITYRPAGGYTGPDSFTYTVDDQHGGIVAATVTVDVTAMNDPPVAVPDFARTAEDVPVGIDVLANDRDADGDRLAVTVAVPPVHGRAVVNPDGTITYVPDPDRNGIDGFAYGIDDGHGGTASAQVTVGVGEANDPPATADDGDDTPEDTPVTLVVLANDRDPDGDRLTVTVVEPPAHGSVRVGGDGAIRYTPGLNYSGADRLRYVADDGHGGAGTAVVAIEVTPVNDPPVAEIDGADTDEDMPVTVDVTANDSDADGDALSVSVVVRPAHGRTTVDGDGRVVYTPVADYAGSDSFTYAVSDRRGGAAAGVVNLNVRPVNDVPVPTGDTPPVEEDHVVTVPVLVNDRDADGDRLQVTLGLPPTHGAAVVNADQSVTYRPGADYHGEDVFTYVASDGNGGAATGTVRVAVLAVNDPPVAARDETVTDEDVPVTLAVLVNDRDVDGDALKVALGAPPSRGSVSILDDGIVVYTPHPNAFGTDSFTYTVDDGHGGTATAPVAVTVRPVNDLPTAVDDVRVVNEDETLVAGVLVNDNDVDGDALAVTLLSPPEHGAAEVTPEKTVVYRPEPDYHGPDVFRYQVDDGHGGTAAAAVNVTVISVNDPPVGLPDLFVRQAGEHQLAVAPPGVLGNDSDIEGDPLESRLFSGAQDGTVTMRPDGSFVYSPRLTHRGGDEFYYRVYDGTDYSEPVRVVINVRDCLDDRPALLELTRLPGYVLCLVERTLDEIIQIEP